MSQCNPDSSDDVLIDEGTTINFDSLSYEVKRQLYENHLKRINDRISELQEMIENRELAVMKGRFIRALEGRDLDICTLLFSDDNRVRRRISNFELQRDTVIENWNKLCGSSSVTSSMES